MRGILEIVSYVSGSKFSKKGVLKLNTGHKLRSDVALKRIQRFHLDIKIVIVKTVKTFNKGLRREEQQKQRTEIYKALSSTVLRGILHIG